MEWAGKWETRWFKVEPVALHLHERVSTQAILSMLQREDVERDRRGDAAATAAKNWPFKAQQGDG